MNVGCCEQISRTESYTTAALETKRATYLSTKWLVFFVNDWVIDALRCSPLRRWTWYLCFEIAALSELESEGFEFLLRALRPGEHRSNDTAEHAIREMIRQVDATRSGVEEQRIGETFVVLTAHDFAVCGVDGFRTEL